MIGPPIHSPATLNIYSKLLLKLCLLLHATLHYCCRRRQYTPLVHQEEEFYKVDKQYIRKTKTDFIFFPELEGSSSFRLRDKGAGRFASEMKIANTDWAKP